MPMSSPAAFNLIETTIDAIHQAYKSGQLTPRQLVQMYVDRIVAYDQTGPSINAVITLNATALEEADRIDAAFQASGCVGSLHGIPVVVKDQADAIGMPTTLGSVLFQHYYPDRDCFVVDKLKRAGAIFLGKTTLGELGGGDTHGSLFGSTRNPYDLERTVGGSSGGSAACVAANFATVGVAQEGLASIRRPATWNCIVGMRPPAGPVGRGGGDGGGAVVRRLLRTNGAHGHRRGKTPARDGWLRPGGSGDRTRRWSCPGQLHGLPGQERLTGRAARHLARAHGLP